jgi:transcriptional regulator with GAF, ATPase, and Fis domain
MNQRQLELQRDLYRLLHDATTKPADVASLLSTALGLVVRLTGARIGYIELRNPEGKKWWSTYHCGENEVEAICRRISTGIIAEAISTGETIVTPSAFLDPRFHARESVSEAHIEAVLCSPFKSDDARGVIYLQGDCDSDFDNTPCLMETELFARHITPLLGLLRSRVESADTLDRRHDLTGIIGKSRAFLDALREAMSIAELDVTVLLTGETGTGKGAFAKAIHGNSPRKYKPFVHLNCANLPEQLAESELFGAARGAHSGAYSDIRGKIAAAREGTLFLDEIGVLALPVQAKLLQFLEEGTYYPLGSQVPVEADVRIIAASNIDFDAATKNGTFRADLYYRLCIFPIRLPSLKKRLDDIPDLVRFFVEKHCKRFNMPTLEIPEPVMGVLQECEWSGNVRQLENKVQHGILRARAARSALLQCTHLLPETHTEPVVFAETLTYREGKDDWERRFIKTNLEKHAWNVSETAKSLGLSRSHLNNLIKLHKLDRSDLKETNA